MTDSRHYQKITAPIHRSTAYDFNVQLDHHAVKRRGTADYHSMVYGGSQEDEHLGVKEHEIVVRRKHNKNRDGRLRVFSSLNNYRYFCKGDELPSESKNDFRQKMHDQLEYVGIAITPQAVVAKHSNQDSQGFAVTRGGLNTIINNGESKIAAGQKVYMTFDTKNATHKFTLDKDHFHDKDHEKRKLINPSHRANGVPHTKVTPIVTTERPVVPTGELIRMFAQSCEEKGAGGLLDLIGAMDGVSAEFTTVMSDLVDKLLARDYQHIGVAVSGAQTGEPFDIVLCG